MANPITNKETFVHLSSIPPKALSEGCILGVDEAGRGPVLGPMVYAACYYVPSAIEDFGGLGFADSKTLNEGEREGLFDVINANSDSVGYAIHSLSPSLISSSMLCKTKYNLNALAHDTTIGLIKSLLEKGVHIKEVTQQTDAVLYLIFQIYVDTVGVPEKYEAKLSREFPYISIKVSKKADSLYPCVSAASICAKVTRDAILKNWKFDEPEFSSLGLKTNFGSGYTSDQNTVAWLGNNMDKVFGWPSIIRFSWATCERMLESKGITIIWPDESAKGSMGLKRAFQKMADQLAKDDDLSIQSRSEFFTKRSMTLVDDL